MGLLSAMESVYLTLEKTAKLFPKWLHIFSSPPVMYENSSWFLFSLTLGMVGLFNSRHSSMQWF